jgi:ATP-dependent DNA ligase I
MLLTELVETSNAVAETSSRLAKIDRLADLLTRTPADELELSIAFLTGAPRQGRIGIAGAAIRSSRDVPPADQATLRLQEVDEAFEAIATTSGAGSARDRVQRLCALLARATHAEQDFLGRLLFGELRQGALEGILVEAVGRAAGIPSAVIRRAAMLEGALAPVARTAIINGRSALERFTVHPLRPVQPMLADSCEDVREALTELGEAALEYKLDGARIQVHKLEDEVRVFSRALRDVTMAVPEVVERVRSMESRELILDGEVVAMRPDGSPHPFQVTMRRFGRKLDIEGLRSTLPVTPFFFDCLYIDGSALIDDPFSSRVDVLGRVAPADIIVPRLVTASPDEAVVFVERALSLGHEGVMAKVLDAPYAAGRRGHGWLKVKQARALDLVVLAVEWGSGRRRGLLSNLHLGARDTERGGFVMLGKTFKGLTDDMLAWQTSKLLELEVARDQHIVYVRPELVVEIAFNEIQVSPQYPGRLALRFARVKSYRTDKLASEADSLLAVQRVYRQMTGLEPPSRA